MAVVSIARVVFSCFTEHNDGTTTGSYLPELDGQAAMTGLGPIVGDFGQHATAWRMTDYPYDLNSVDLAYLVKPNNTDTVTIRGFVFAGEEILHFSLVNDQPLEVPFVPEPKTVEMSGFVLLWLGTMLRNRRRINIPV